MKVKEDPILLEFELNASRKEIWSALTEVKEMRKWFFENIPEFRAEKGFTIDFAVFSGKRKFTHQWEIQEVLFEQKLVYGWKYREYPGDSKIEFTIQNKGKNSILLHLRITVLEDFDDQIPEFKRESCIGGWEYFIGKNLKKYLLDKK